MREVVLAPAAVRQFKRLPARVRSHLRSVMRELLELQDAAEETRNRFRLRRPSTHADFELRVESWRVFYRVGEDIIFVELIGEKRGNTLWIEGKEFVL
ncbi:MAG: type II toxin-antitoxin system RelE/ParE family toxin [Planctomycetes bacterium]|nr:type II toxin-antitoxin system RelE/ParE family toxin [Planctomycetota bacterium]